MSANGDDEDDRVDECPKCDGECEAIEGHDDYGCCICSDIDPRDAWCNYCTERRAAEKAAKKQKKSP